MPFVPVLLMFATAPASAPVPITPLPVTARHLAYEVDARIVHAVRWRDRLGDHTVLLAESGELRSSEPCEMGDCRNASVYAYEYLETGGKTRRVWKLEDHQRACPFDLRADFVPGSTVVTDIDGDGEAEVTFQYTLQCTSDVSPSTRKLILREGKDKYAIRGTTRSKFYAPYGDEYEPDPAFKGAPAAFLPHAKAQWEAFIDDYLDTK
jgi:hypothetical protein